MIDVLADVVFIQPNGPVRGNGKILHIDQIVFDRIRAPVFKLDLPAPGRPILRQNQPRLISKPLKLPLGDKTFLMHSKAAWAVRTQQRCDAMRVAHDSEKEVGRGRFRLIPRKQVDDNVLVGKSPDGSVPVDFD